MRHSYLLHLTTALASCGFLIFTAGSLNASNLPPGFAEVRIAQNLDPTAMAQTPDGRILIAEKNGRVLVIEGGTLREEPLVTVEVDNYNERGLSGIAVHPDFVTNGFFYLYYTVKDAERNRVSRFTASGNSVIPGSEKVILNLDTGIGTVHMGGAMAFGPDGKLYISVGDGSRHQSVTDMQSFLGKILRINDDGTIPEDNPFYHSASGNYRAIYALGFRNSFSMTIQPVTGRIFATEVGSASWEEINEILPGRNYGWPAIEGPLAGQDPPENYKEPVYAYDHSKGCAVVGATFYHPESPLFPPEYHGMFFFADYCGGYLKYLDPDQPEEIHTFATGIARPLNLIVSPDGSLYYLARAGIGGGSEEDNTSSTSGSLWRVFYNGSGAPFFAVDPQPVLVSVNEDVSFVTQASGTQPITYQWQQNGVDIPGATQKLYIRENVTLADSGSLFRCIATNISGADTTNEAELRVTANQRPVPVIFMPADGQRYRGGDVLAFSGYAEDAEQGALPPSVFKWRIDFHHDQHTHPALAPTAGIAEGVYFIPQLGETAVNVWYRIHLTVDDAAGLVGEAVRDIFPRRTQFAVMTQPAGIPVVINGKDMPTPTTTESVVGIIHRLEAHKTIPAGDSIRIFKAWSNGNQDPVLAFAAEEDTVIYTAIYETIAYGSGTGMTAYYYDGPPYDPTFYEPYAFTRTDSVIDFNWGEGSPYPDALGDDFWLVRWEGFIEPLVSDEYTFSVLSDDGSRLWVDDRLIVNAWMNQPANEWSGTISLEKGKYYPLRLEYFESGGAARCHLTWSSQRLDKVIIPQSQLYIEAPQSVVDHEPRQMHVYPNPATDILLAAFEDFNGETIHIELYNVLGQRVLSRIFPIAQGLIQLDVRSLPPGMYWIKGTAETVRYGPTGMIKQ